MSLRTFLKDALAFLPVVRVAADDWGFCTPVTGERWVWIRCANRHEVLLDPTIFSVRTVRGNGEVTPCVACTTPGCKAKAYVWLDDYLARAATADRTVAARTV